MTGESTQRRAVRAGEPDTPRVEPGEAVWRIRSLSVARQVLRARHATTQAGFTAEAIPRGFLRHHPILVSDGPLHDEQRAKVARFFAPAVVGDRYADQMADCADRLLADAVRQVNRERGITVLLVEQDVGLALEIATRGYVLQTGRIVLAGSGRELLDNPDIQKAYLGI